MKKRMNNIYKIILLILCIGISSFGASGRKVQASWAKSGAMRHYLRKIPQAGCRRGKSFLSEADEGEPGTVFGRGGEPGHGGGAGRGAF